MLTTFEAILSFTYLFSSKFDLEVLGRFLSHSSAKVQLVDLAALIPHRCFVVHDKLPSLRPSRWAVPEAVGRVLRAAVRTRVTAVWLDD